MMTVHSEDLTNGKASFNGPLRVHADNSRYFSDDTGHAIYLAGSHTWPTIQERQLEDTPNFDYPVWLDFMERFQHNFLRLWVWEHTAWMQFTEQIVRYSPNPYQRTGPGKALDGELKFDLTKFNDAYFDRLRSRVVAAGERGIYVSVMFFQGFSVDKRRSDSLPKAGNAYHGHPMHPDNNINGIDGDPNGSGTGRQIHTLDVPAITALQEAYVMKVIDTLNDLDHVLWEIGNEVHESSIEWQYHMIDFVHEYEQSKAKQHLVGMTGAPIQNDALYNSPADWISPFARQDYMTDPPVGETQKIVILDTDHGAPLGANPTWPWRSFTRGQHFIVMDPYRDVRYGSPAEPVTAWNEIRRQMGHTLQFAQRMNLNRAEPHGELSSTTYCLADPGREYLVYLPDAGAVVIDLSTAKVSLVAEWFNPQTGQSSSASNTVAGRRQELVAPFEGHAVLYIHQVQ